MQERKAPPPISSYVPKWPEAKGRPYRTIFMEMQKKPEAPKPIAYEFVSLQCTYQPRQKFALSTFDKVLAAVCDAFDVAPADLLSNCRKRVCAYPRFALYLLLSEYLPWSLPMIGRKCNRDHTSVIHGMRRARDLLAIDEDFRTKYATAKNHIVPTEAPEQERGNAANTGL